jgi:hypothetical protein
MYALDTIQPSRFRTPCKRIVGFLSAIVWRASLVEGLVLVQRVMMSLWDRIPELALALHLHNMLVKRGYLKREVDLYATLDSLLQDAFFPDSVPTYNFQQALSGRVAQRNGPAALRQRQAFTIFTRFLLPNSITSSRPNSTHDVCDSKFLPERIPDGDLKILSILYMLRLSQTERILDPYSNEKRLKETELVKRAISRGQTSTELLK